jgi:hypothetical protein
MDSRTGIDIHRTKRSGTLGHAAANRGIEPPDASLPCPVARSRAMVQPRDIRRAGLEPVCGAGRGSGHTSSTEPIIARSTRLPGPKERAVRRTATARTKTATMARTTSVRRAIDVDGESPRGNGRDG